MTTLTKFTFALLTAAALASAGCDKRDDMPPTGAGPGTTTAPDNTTGTPGSMNTTPAMPPASAASQ
jgi:hypothetical protein